MTAGALVAGGVVVAATVASSAPVLALTDTSQSTEIAVEQAEINTLSTGTTPQVATGGSHTCAVLNTGAVNCWGFNGSGQLGDGTTTKSLVPVPVGAFTGGATAVSITAGGAHTCALLNTGAVNCWGHNGYGQLGNGTTTKSLVPVPVGAFTGGATAVSITAGGSHTCAVLNTGVVNCWGWNGIGQLGNGNTTDSSVPVPVGAFTGGATAVSITAGNAHTCAVLNTGAVNCWGRNDYGQLGNGTTTDSSVPVPVNAFTGGATAVSITAGNAHTCAVLNTGAVNCWGYNGIGQLGNNSLTDSSVPVKVGAFTDGVTAVSITAGNYYTCAVLNTGAANCWGHNSYGRLGDGTTTDSPVPVPVDPFTDVTATAVSITAGNSHTCALLNTGAVNCWGENWAGQLGNGTTTDSSVPVPVGAFTGGVTAVSITAGNQHTCALLNTGAVNCWGYNWAGQLGNGTTTDSSVPVAVAAFTGGVTAVSITAGNQHTCALLNTGAVNCWGYNWAGQLGDGTTTDRSVPVPVNAFTGGVTAVSITAGNFHTCALLNTGAVNCWGYNWAGQLGDGTTTDRSVPVPVNAFTGGVTAVSITAGDFHTCALLNTGVVNCWGRNNNGQLGNGNTTASPVPVPVGAFTGGATAVSITAGGFHTCALLNTGVVNCWGNNGNGQLGNGTTTKSLVPVPVGAFTGGVTAVSITAGGDHTCAVLNTGAVNCWGNNGNGQLGNGTTTKSLVPVPVGAFTGGATAVSITAGGDHTCAVLNTGAVNCWGYNGIGQLGNNSLTKSLVPAKVMLFVPGVPTAVSGVAGNSEVVVSWTAPASDGGSVISSYTVTSSPDNKTCSTAGLSCTVVGLTNGTAYTFTVAATNAAGVGPASNQSAAVTPIAPPIAPPGAPAGVSGVAGDSEVVVSWTAPASDGGSVISSYTVTSSPDNKTCSTAGLSCTVAGLTNGTAYTFTVAATNAAGVGPASNQSAAVTPVAPLVALVAGRLLETRVGEASTVDGLFWKMGQRSAGSVTQLVVNGRGGVASDATAVVLNVTVTGTERAGYLTVYPCGAPRPLASNLNYSAGQTIANTLTSKVSAAGKVCIYTSGPTHLIADINGYFPAGSSFVALVPGRLLETRVGEASTVDGLFGKMGQRSAGSVTQLVVNGRGGVASDAAAVVFNVTVTGTERAGYLTVYPCDAPRPLASNLNYSAGQTIANTVTSKVGAAGKVCIYTSGPTHLIADINGYFAAGSSFVALVPGRLLETRVGEASTVDGLFWKMGQRSAGSVTQLVVNGRGGVASDAAAVVFNVTVTGTERAGYLTVYPCGEPRPLTSNLNYSAGQTIANTVTSKVSAAGKVCIYTSGPTHLIADINGFFAAG